MYKKYRVHCAQRVCRRCIENEHNLSVCYVLCMHKSTKQNESSSFRNSADLFRFYVQEAYFFSCEMLCSLRVIPAMDSKFFFGCVFAVFLLQVTRPIF